MIETEAPDVVVLDLGLPLVSGWDVYRDLRSRRATKRLPVIIVTGNDLMDINQDDVSVLPKPVDPLVLITAVHDVVHRRR